MLLPAAKRQVFFQATTGVRLMATSLPEVLDFLNKRQIRAFSACTKASHRPSRELFAFMLEVRFGKNRTLQHTLLKISRARKKIFLRLFPNLRFLVLRRKWKSAVFIARRQRLRFFPALAGGCKVSQQF